MTNLWGERVGEKVSVPLELEEGENEVRRVDGVELEKTLAKETCRGFLLLTDRRLIFNGKLSGGKQLLTAFEWSLNDVVGCVVKNSLFGKKKLAIIISRVVVKVRQITGKVFTTPVETVRPYEFTGIDQPEVVRSEILQQVEKFKSPAS